MRAILFSLLFMVASVVFAFDLAVLQDELATDPLARGYAAMTNAEATNDLNTKYRYKIKSSMTASEVIQSIAVSDYQALAASDKEMVWNILHLGNINPQGVEATLMANIFGGASTTIANLAEARKDPISRAEELGQGKVKEGWVQQVRQ